MDRVSILVGGIRIMGGVAGWQIELLLPIKHVALSASLPPPPNYMRRLVVCS